MDAEKLYGWKFIIPHAGVQLDEERTFFGCLAIAVAPSEEQARANLKRFAAENGVDLTWIDLCDNKPERGKLVKVELLPTTVLGVAMV